MSTTHASVPYYWLGKFLGHKIWFRPEGVADCDWRELIDLCIMNGQIKGWVWHDGQLKSGNLAKLTTVQDVPLNECTEQVYHERTQTYRTWEWQPPEGKCPPDIPVREPDWRPKGHPITVTPAPAGDDGALFTL